MLAPENRAVYIEASQFRQRCVQSNQRLGYSIERGNTTLSNNFHEHFRDTEVIPPSERATGIVFACVALLVAAFSYATPTVAGPALAVSAAFALTSWLRPAFLAPLNRAWFRLSLLLNRVVNPVVMLLIYSVAIVPAGLVMQVLRDPLAAKRPRERSSYWRDRDPIEVGGTMSNQF